MPAEAPTRAPQPLVFRALKEAAVTGLLGVALFLPLVAFTTVQSMRNELVLETRWGLFFAFVAVVAVLRFLHILIIAPWLERRPPKATAASAPAPRWRKALSKWFAPFAIGFVAVYPPLVLTLTGWSGALKWIDNFGIQILIYVMLGWGLNIVVGLAGLLDLGYVAFYAVGAYSYALLSQEPSASLSGCCCRWPESLRRSGASCSVFRCCACAAITSPSSRWPLGKSSGWC